MGFKKYVNDYKLENVPNKHGKLVTKAVYKGDYYVYSCRGEELKTARITVAACTAVAAVAFLLGIVFYRNTGWTAQYYTLVPFASCFLPLVYLCIAAFNVIRTGEGKKVDHEHKDGIHDRISKCCVGIMALDGLNISGIVISSVLKITGVETRLFTFYDAMFMICSATLILAAAFAFFGPRKKLVMNVAVS